MPSDRATIAAADAALVVVGTTKDDEGEALDRNWIGTIKANMVQGQRYPSP